MVFLFAFSSNSAEAAVGNQEIEVSFEFQCGAALPGMPPLLNPSPLTFKANVPERVAAGEEFYLTKASYLITLPLYHPDGVEPMEAIFEQPNFRIAYGNDVVRVFKPDETIVVPPGTDGFPYMVVEGEEVGPFVVHEEGEIDLKLAEYRMNIAMYEGDFKLALGIECPVPEDADFTFATVTVDGTAPVLTLNGDSTMIVKQGDPFEDPGATAQDNYDGDLTDQIEVSGDVDTNTIGTYTLTYTVSDSVGNETTVERIVEVVEPFGSWLTGEGAPSDDIGRNGDLYLDKLTGDIYKRNPQTWEKISNLKGDDGKQGSAILTGSGAPSADDGNVGDLYFNTATGDVYEKTADGWSKIANLQGPAGPQGPKGADGTGGTSGDSSSKDKKSGAGKSKVTAKGDDDGKGTAAKGGKLPKTATSLPTLILIGALLTMAGGVLFFRRKKAIE